MKRVIRFFKSDSDVLGGEFSLGEEVSLDFLQEIFSIPKENPMYDSYPIDLNAARMLECLTDFKFDLKTYDYFLECSS